MIGVGRAATGEISEIQEIKETDEEAELDFLIHNYYLRPGLSVEITLPVDLTQHEAERLAMFIKSLSFGADL